MPCRPGGAGRATTRPERRRVLELRERGLLPLNREQVLGLLLGLLGLDSLAQM
jgi:hypothetical protein